MEEITIVDTELEVEDEVILLDENGEVVAEEIEQNTEIVVPVYDDTILIETLTEIRFDVRILVLLSILTFCSACLRGWRNNVIKGAR